MYGSYQPSARISGRNPLLRMNPRIPLVVLTAALVVTPGARLLAFSTSIDEADARLRLMSLDLLDRQARAAADLENARAETARLAPTTYDLNHDGWLDVTEFAAWEKQVRIAAEKAPHVLKKFDKNHDKKLDDAEWAAARLEIMPK